MTQAHIDMAQFAEAKVDRITADDLIGGPRTITITGASGAVEDGKKQAIISFEGDDGKPFKPCKTMVRVMMAIWGSDGSKYAGRSMTLYRDPAVTFGGLAMGGVRISHMSHMDKETVVVVAAKKGKKGPIKILPLVMDQPSHPTEDGAAKWANGYIAKIEAVQTIEELIAFENERAAKLNELREKRPELHQRCVDAAQARGAALAPEGKPDSEPGEGFTDEPADDGADQPSF